MGHAALAHMLQDLGENGPLTRTLRHRYREAVMIIRDPQGAGIVIQPGCGGLQGDSTMPEMFSATYDPHVHNWIQNRSVQLADYIILATDPITGVTLEVGTTLYAETKTGRASVLRFGEKTIPFSQLQQPEHWLLPSGSKTLHDAIRNRGAGVHLEREHQTRFRNGSLNR